MTTPLNRAGITAHGAYVPIGRLSLSALGAPPSEGGDLVKAVAAFDEDSVTMGVAAAMDCLHGIDRSIVDGVLFASTTYAYKEKLGASLIAKALDLRRDVFTLDASGSLRAGTSLFLRAWDAVRAGSARCVLVIASDCRTAIPRSPLDRDLGDGAAAFLIGDGDAIATLESSHAIADEILDLWRTDSDRCIQSWEDRFTTKHGYRENILEAVSGLARKTGRKASDFDRVVLYGPDARAHSGVVRTLGIDPSRVEDPLFGKVGNTGAAFVPLLLSRCLERAKPGERILAASYGDGAEALSLVTTNEVEERRPRRGVTGHIARGRRVADYHVYLRARGLEVSDVAPRKAGGISATAHWRDRDEDISFKAQRCNRCGTEQFPFQRICYRCHAKDDHEAVRLTDRTGRLLSFSFDHFHPSPETPTIAGMFEIEGGCRVYLMMADALPEEVRLDLPVELTFRKIHEAGGKPNYFWKASPLHAGVSQRGTESPGDATSGELARVAAQADGGKSR